MESPDPRPSDRDPLVRTFDTLEARLEKQTLLASIATRFISIDPDQIDDAVSDALAAIGRFAGVGRAVLALIEDNERTWRISHEWHREGIPPLGGVFEHVAPFPWALARLRQGLAVDIPSPDKLPPEAAAEAGILERFGGSAMLLLPVTQGERLIGFAAFTSSRPWSDRWPDALHALLRLPGRMMVHALARRSAERALRESQSLWQSLCDSNVVGVFVLRRDGTVLESNDAGLRILGRGREELAAGIAWKDTTPEDHREKDRRMLAIVDRTGRALPWEKEALRPDGTRVPVLTTLTSLAPESDRLLSLSIDLSSRRRVEEELRRRDEVDRLHASLSRRLIDLPAEAIDDALGSAIEAMAEMFGFDAVAVYDVDAAVDRAVRRSFRCRTVDVVPTESLLLSRRPWWRQRLRAGRTTYIADIALAPEEARREREDLRFLGMAGFASLPLLPSGNMRGFINFGFVRPMSLADDALATLRVFADILANAIERRRTDLEIAGAANMLEQRVEERRAQLEASNAELEAFAYSVSHDLRAPLRVIDGMSQVLREDFTAELGDEALSLLRRIQAAAQRMGALIEGLLQLSRVVRTPMEWRQVDLSAIAAEAAEVLQRLNPDRSVEVRIAPGLSTSGHPRLLAAAIEKVLENAFKFTRPIADACIGVEGHHEDERLVLDIRDNGVGFDPRFARKLFEAFERLHPADEFEGHGIGLAIVERILRMHGGHAWAEPAAGGGAAFHLALPLQPEPQP